MDDWKTTLTPVATLIVAGTAKYGLNLPVELVLGILGFGFLALGYFSKDKNRAATNKQIQEQEEA